MRIQRGDKRESAMRVAESNASISNKTSDIQAGKLVLMRGKRSSHKGNGLFVIATDQILR